MNQVKVAIVIPAYNVAKVLKKTVDSLPSNCADSIILVNDGSQDKTESIAFALNLFVVSHDRNRGYGGAQKTGYQEALKQNANIVVMVHGDNQYDPSVALEFIKKIRDEDYDVVTGTRFVLGDVLKNGMPIWKFVPNRLLTWLENFVFNTRISDYHNGYRAYSGRFLKSVPLDLLSEKYDFDTDIMIQAAIRKVKIAEIPHRTRYCDENSQMSFSKGVHYGLSILATIVKYLLHQMGIKRQALFEGKQVP